MNENDPMFSECIDKKTKGYSPHVPSNKNGDGDSSASSPFRLTEVASVKNTARCFWWMHRVVLPRSSNAWAVLRYKPRRVLQGRGRGANG